MKWKDVEIHARDGLRRAIAPEIISASRSTDIPAFYSDWFMNRLREGFVKWVNPFNQQPQYVSFCNARVIVFWSKNPAPLMPYLDEIDKRGLTYYFHFTLNDYDVEHLEPGVPPLEDRIKTFKSLSERVGKEKVIWRYDPLILTDTLTVEGLLKKIERVGDQIAPFTSKLVFSYADIGLYRKVQANFVRKGIKYVEFDEERMKLAGKGISDLCRGWRIPASTCAEPVDLSAYGISHNRCIDDDLILRITDHSPDVKTALGLAHTLQADMFNSDMPKGISVKDPGQRASCGCVMSKDIGQYNTCPHLCVYCYANSSENIVNRNTARSSSSAESILPDV